jgi:hypothetical protein
MAGTCYNYDKDPGDADHSNSCQQMYVVQEKNKITHMLCDRPDQGKTDGGILL